MPLIFLTSLYHLAGNRLIVVLLLKGTIVANAQVTSAAIDQVVDAVRTGRPLTR